MKTLIKKWFGSEPGVTDPLELALLKSIRTEPELWEVVYHEMALVARSRNRNALVTSCGISWAAAASDKLKFSPEFAAEWHPIVQAIYAKRKSEADTAAANATRKQMEKAFGI